MDGGKAVTETCSALVERDLGSDEETHWLMLTICHIFGYSIEALGRFIFNRTHFRLGCTIQLLP